MSIKIVAKKPVVKLSEGVKTQLPKETKAKAPKEDKEFKQLIKQVELQISDTAKLVFSVSRMGEEGLPHIDIRTYAETDLYTGPTKKGINFPVEFLLDFIEIIDAVNNECEEKGF